MFFPYVVPDDFSESRCYTSASEWGLSSGSQLGRIWLEAMWLVWLETRSFGQGR